MGSLTMTLARSRIFAFIVLALSVQSVQPFFLRFYPFFKLFHHPYHHPHHHPHHKVVRYVTYYDEPYSYHHHSYSHTPHHKYNSYSIDRKDDISSRLSVDDTKLMPLDHMCEGLSSPEKELCVLCWGETEPERRRMCYKDPCALVTPESRDTCHSLALQYLQSVQDTH